MSTPISSPFTHRQLAGTWRVRLQALRKNLVADLDQLAGECLADETPGAADPTDVGQPQEVAIAESDNAADILRLIDRALAKIDGAGPVPFGICERTGQAIERERLDLAPWTPYSVLGARSSEAAAGQDVTLARAARRART